MSISAIDGQKNVKRRLLETALVYLLIAGACFLFGMVYESYAHGVESRAMRLFFAIPLVGGASFYFLLALCTRFFSRWASNTYNAGLAVLTVGCCLEGVFEIYGTASPYVPYYYLSGGVLLMLSSILLGFALKNKKKTLMDSAEK